MKCQKCKRPLEPGEPVYRFMFDWQMLMGHKACMPEARGWSRKFLDPSQCDRCSRLVYRERPQRKGSRIFACSLECRQAIHNATFRKRHPRWRIKRTCQDCGETFTPTRSDTKFCSVACKQHAYRLRRYPA
jgi:hypothetical protein